MPTNFLDTKVLFFCPYGSKITTLTFRDSFKLILPVTWTTIALLSIAVYVIIPLWNDDIPPWEEICIVALSAVSGIGLSLATYGFHRHASTFAIEENYSVNYKNGSEEGRTILIMTKQKMRHQSLRFHAFLSTLLALVSIGLVVFFGAFATTFDMCAHESCGPDLLWSGIALFVSILWIIATYLGYRDLRNARTQTAKSMKDFKSETMKTMPEHISLGTDESDKSKEEDLV